MVFINHLINHNMDFILVLVGLSIMWLFMFKIEWLFNSKSFMVIIIYDIILFIHSHILLHFQIGNPKIIPVLKMPLISSIVFFILYRAFKKLFNRDPENTFWTFSKRPIQDIIFTILFWLLGGGMPFILLKYLN